MKKHITYLLLLIVLLASCKIGQSSTAQNTKTPKTRRDTTLSPDGCLINAKVLRMVAEGVYSLRVYEVKETGFGFSQNLNPGDKIEVRYPLTLKTDETSDFTIEWVEAVGGGYYQIKTGAE